MRSVNHPQGHDGRWTRRQAQLFQGHLIYSQENHNLCITPGSLIFHAVIWLPEGWLLIDSILALNEKSGINQIGCKQATPNNANVVNSMISLLLPWLVYVRPYKLNGITRFVVRPITELKFGRMYWMRHELSSIEFFLYCFVGRAPPKSHYVNARDLRYANEDVGKLTQTNRRKTSGWFMLWSTAAVKHGIHK